MRYFRAALSAAVLCVTLCATLCLGASAAHAQGSLLPLPEQKPIRGADFPALSPGGKTLCFGYLGDLWTVPATGGTATRLTIHEAEDTMPHWSPDGHWIAFTSNREGNFDVYVIAATGGPARQLTYHSSNDWAMDWSPDGSKVLFYGQRDTNTFQLYSIDVKTGAVKTLTNDDNMIRYGCYSPDGQSIAYDRGGSIAVWWRPKYHGSANMEIYSRNLSSGKITRVTDYDGTDLWPMYSADGRDIFYASDRLTPGTANIVVSAATGGKPALITRHKDGQVRFPSIARNGSAIAYEHSGDLYVVPVSAHAAVGDSKKLAIYAPTDDKANNVTRLTLTNGATEAEISPDGKTLALVIRGEVWTIPTSGGDAKRLTSNPARDYDIIWSADSKKLYFISDRNGSFNLFSLDVDSKEVKPVSTYALDESSPKLSPDGKSLAFLRSGVEGGIFVWPVDGSAAPRRVAESKGNNLEFGVGINSYSWSPDGKWIAFSRRDTVDTSDVWVVPVAGGAAKNVTYYPGQNNDPEWTSDAKFLLFVSNRDGQEDVYKLPLVPEKEEPDTAAPAPAGNPAGGTGATTDAKKHVEVKIDFDEIQDRAKRLTTQGTGAYEITPDGKQVIYVAAAGGAPDFYMIPVAGGSAARLTSSGVAAGVPRFTTDAGKFYALGPGGSVNLIQRTGPIWQAQPIAFSARMDFDRRAEIRQAFNEFWRRLNVGFYDPNMHGVDWRAVRARYEPLLEGVGTKEDFSMFLLSAMVGELNASHSEIGPAPGPPGPKTGELGITFDENYAGPGLKVTGYMPKGPDDDLGPRVKPGEYVMAIDGEDVTWNEAMYQTLADKAGKTVELLVNSKPSKEGARTIKLKPITVDAWRELEYQRKVKEERDKVTKLSDGRIAYLHIKGMDQPSLHEFERELWGKGREADALVLDIRENGGGNTHDAILSQLSRTLYGFTQPRDAEKVTQPVRYWGKPIVLLINQNSASDAEIFPMGFRNLKLGKIVGVPTPGYVIGTYNGRLQDGTTYRIPMWGWFGPDGRDMENVGVKPDVTVEETEEDLERHRDRQLEVAVDMLLKELPKKKG